MADTPNEAPAEAPKAPESVETPINTNQEPAQAPAQAPDMHGFTSEDLAGMRTFIDNNGGWDKIKSRISNPEPAQSQNPTSQPQAQPVEPQTPQQPTYTPPQGSITRAEYEAKRYAADLASEKGFEPISDYIRQGDFLKDMSRLGISLINQDGSYNDGMVREFLSLKAQTVPAKGTGTEPNASPAPTVEYVQATDGKITSMDQAYAILDQDMRLKAQGLAGNPDIALAEEFIKTGGKPVEKKAEK